VLVQTGDDLEHACVEVGLEGVVVFQVVSLHEGHDARISLPVGSRRFVSADVNVVVGENCGHLCQEAVYEGIRRLACGIDSVVAYPELAADLIGRATTGKFRVGHKPGGAVSRHLEFRHHANTAGASIGNNLLCILLGIEKSVGSFGGQVGIDAAFHAEALVFREVPVEDVELDGGHAIKGALNHGDGLEVAAAVNHEATPAESRLVVDRNGRDHVAAAARLDELEEGFETMHGAHLACSFEFGARGRDAERVALVFIEGLDRRGRMIDLDDEPG